MKNAAASLQGTVRFLLLLTAVLVLMNIGAHAAWNRPEKEMASAAWSDISLRYEFGGLRQPTHITHAGDGSNRLFITEQRGRILLLRGAKISGKPFLDISKRVGCCGERGLLSVAFPPGYKEKKYFYVNYTDKSGDTVVARFRVTQEPDIADPDSEEIILTVKQPYANHNGGQLAFGPDGYLYVGMGDGGSAGDPHGYAQNPSSLLGKLLRIDVESGRKPYAVPPDTPFAGNRAYRPEIWSTGLRNPWRFSFDRKTGDLFIADVGQDKYEEIDFEPNGSRGGRNYGWNIMEGLHCYLMENCRRDGLALPVAEYGHDQGCSVTGGVVYRGMKFPQLQGTYLYGDFCSGKIWGLRRSGAEWQNRMLKDSGLSISTFGEDESGEVHVADYGRGNIYRIEAEAR